MEREGTEAEWAEKGKWKETERDQWRVKEKIMEGTEKGEEKECYGKEEERKREKRKREKRKREEEEEE